MLFCFVMNNGRVLVLTGTLPVHSRDGEEVFAPSYSSAAASILYSTPEELEDSVIFFGTPGYEGFEDISNDRSNRTYRSVRMTKFRFVSVRCKKGPKDLLFSQHISRACHMSLGKSSVFPEDLGPSYREYLEFNRTYVEEVKQIYQKNDVILVMSKHLIFVPSLVREVLPFAKISFVFLFPFPPYELFSCIPYSKEAVLSLLSSDKIEFLSNEYMKNFVSTSFSLINAQNKEITQSDVSRTSFEPHLEVVQEKAQQRPEKNVVRFLPPEEKRDVVSLLAMTCGLDSDAVVEVELESPPSPVLSACPEEYLQDTMPALALFRKDRKKRTYVVYKDSRRALVGTSAVFGPGEFIRSVLETKNFQENFERLKNSKKNKKLVLIIETTRSLCAPKDNLQAASAYLQKKKDGATDFIRCVLYGESSCVPNAALSSLAERISGAFPGRLTTVIFPNTLLYLSLLSIASVCVVGAPQDAMSLVAAEYLLCNPEGTVVAPFSTGISCPNIQYTMNCPHITAALIERILHAKEKAPARASREDVKKAIRETYAWVRDLSDIQRSSSVSTEEEGEAVSACKKICPEIEKTIKSQYDASESRLILLDYDGTLTEIVPDPKDAKPTAEILALLKSLSEDKRNRLLIVTGRSKEEAERWFGALSITIYAEHGAYKREKHEWKGTPCDLSWMPDAVKVIKEYVAFTPGSHIEVKNTCVVFHCKEAGRWCANALSKILEGRARVVTGKNIIEVRPFGIDKGACVMKEYKKGVFTICAGDDVTDEDMFMVLHNEENAYTICVGERSTCASLRASSPSDIRRVLGDLSRSG